jgi:hypothetical protein
MADTVAMRIALLSDIHIDIAPGIRQVLLTDAIADAVRGSGADVLVIAGDVANAADKVGRYLERIAVAPHNLYVPGNHCVWRSSRDLLEGRESFAAHTLLRRRAVEAGFSFLPGAPVRIDAEDGTWGFAGALGWYDYTMAPAWATPAMIADKRYDGTTWSDGDNAAFIDRRGRRLTDPEVVDAMLASLEADLRALGLDEAGGGIPTVAVTHTLPYRSMCLYRDMRSWDYFASFIGSTRIGDLYDRYPAVRAAFAGHTHIPHLDVRPDGRVRATAPLGYYGTAEFPAAIESRMRVFETRGRSLSPAAP